MIRQRIIEALRFYEYLIPPDVVITQTDCSAEMTYEPLTDNGLFSLCREQGDKHGSLKLFVEASTLVYADEYERPCRNRLPKIVVSVLDWDNQEKYFNIDMTGLEHYEVHAGLRKKVKAQTHMKLVRIYGPEPDTWFSWEPEKYRLFDLIQEKGASTGYLKLFVILQEVSHQEDYPVTSLDILRLYAPSSASPSPRIYTGYVPAPKTCKLSLLGQLRSWLRKSF
ncbi:hypothetical protein BYT27DRAFT_6963326 [Phlegmacium glaucopus]|nr:hypothetical protein BYT27DRAFT_6963326 [Phlegmacium glaucopus]